MTDTATAEPVHFVHYCQCGKWGSFGIGGAKDAPIRWYCGEHKPK